MTDPYLVRMAIIAGVLFVVSAVGLAFVWFRVKWVSSCCRATAITRSEKIGTAYMEVWAECTKCGGKCTLVREGT